MTVLKRRVGKLEVRLVCWRAHFLLEAYQRQQDIEAEVFRLEREKVQAAEREARAAREAAERERREAEVAAERTARSSAENAPSSPPSPATPSLPVAPPAWSYDPPESMQIRPVHWGRSVAPADDGGRYGRALTDYDPLADDDDDYDFDDDDDDDD